MLKPKSAFFEFILQIVNGDIDQVTRRLADDPALVTAFELEGASRATAEEFFITEIAHYLNVGDTGLHMAAAAFRRPMAELLVGYGADCLARNRYRAQPLHYATDTNHWDPAAQVEMIEYLLAIGADVNSGDGREVTPLHRAVRTRSLLAVRALLDGGADLRCRNQAGSTPLHLAVQNTGRPGSGSEHAREQQAGIIKLLLERGARVTDQDRKGKTVLQWATSEWVRTVLSEFSN
jgi:ankyrin repeat protein